MRPWVLSCKNYLVYFHTCSADAFSHPLCSVCQLLLTRDTKAPLRCRILKKFGKGNFWHLFIYNSFIGCLSHLNGWLRHVHEFRNLMKTKIKITRVLDKISKLRLVYIFVLTGHQDSYIKKRKNQTQEKQFSYQLHCQFIFYRCRPWIFTSQFVNVTRTTFLWCS